MCWILLFKWCQFQFGIVHLFFNKEESNFWESKMCQWRKGRERLKVECFWLLCYCIFSFPDVWLESNPEISCSSSWGRQDTYGKDWFSVLSHGSVLVSLSKMQRCSVLTLQDAALSVHWDTFFFINISRGTECTSCPCFPHVLIRGLNGRQLFRIFSL